MCRCPLLAQSGHCSLQRTCLLLGVKRTCRFALQMSAFDPKRTSASPCPNPLFFWILQHHYIGEWRVAHSSTNSPEFCARSFSNFVRDPPCCDRVALFSVLANRCADGTCRCPVDNRQR